MLPVFEAFSLKCLQLKQAVRLGDDRLVRVLDRELEPLIDAVFAYRAENPYDVYLQLQFMSNLIRDGADDRSCVVRHSAALSVLLDRYFASSGPSDTTLRDFPQREMTASPYIPGEDHVLNEVILDSLPDRVAVVTPDYRYLYTNQAFTALLGKSQIEIIGSHVREFVGADMFENNLKEKFDCCFAGLNMDYACTVTTADETDLAVRCRMVPLFRSGKSLLGAIVTLQDDVGCNSIAAA